MTTRMAEAFLFYLTFSIKETPVILRTIHDRPYEEIDVLRVWMTFIGCVTVRRKRRTLRRDRYASRFGLDIMDRLREEQAPPLQWALSASHLVGI